MFGTASASFVKSSVLSLDLANPNNAPAPPVAWCGVMESPLLSEPMSSGFGDFAMAEAALGVCALVGGPAAHHTIMSKSAPTDIAFALLCFIAFSFFGPTPSGLLAKGIDPIHRRR